MTGPGMIAAARGWVSASLQRQFLLLLLLLLSILSGVFLSMVVLQYRSRMIDEHARASMQVNMLLQASLENAMLKRDIPGLRQIIAKLGKQPGIKDVSIVNPSFEVRFASDEAMMGKVFGETEFSKALSTRQPQTSFVTGRDGNELLRSINPVHNQQPCSVCHGLVAEHPVNGLLVVDYDAASIRQNALHSAILLGSAGALVMGITGIGLWFGLKRLILDRVEGLRDASRRLKDGDYDARVKMRGSDEIGALGQSFNAMAGQLGGTHERLNRAEQFLQGVIDAIPDGVRVIDDNFNILKANRQYCRQLRLGLDEVVGHKCYASSHGRSEPCPQTLVTCPVIELRKQPLQRIKVRHQHLRTDRSELFVEISAVSTSLMVGSNEVSCVVESIRDLEEQAKISQEQRLSEIGFLATGVAHEIHNPLSSIAYALSALSISVDDGDADPRNLHYIDTAKAEIDKCLKVTDSLMRLSQPPGADFQLVNLAGVVGSVLSLVSFQARESGISVKLEIDPALRVLADDSDLRMVAINLAQNAFHAMKNGGVLSVAARRSEAWIEITFTDTGIGIARQNLDKIFLPFWTKRADDSGGHGLGLTICKAAIDRLGGSISVESTVGAGTAFTIRLPDPDWEGTA